MRNNLIELINDCRYMDGYGMDLVEKQADYLLANGVTIQRWIPVEERLPEEYEGWGNTTSVPVLVAFKRYGGSVGITTSFTLGGKWVTAVEVTHWMPLPSTEGLG